MQKTLMILIAVAVLAGSTLATETRVLTMGDNNMILLDEANIVLFPSRLIDYPNLAIGEFQPNDMTQLGIHWKPRENMNCVLGTYLHNNTAENHRYLPINAPLGQNKRIDLYHGRMLGQHKFGFHLGYRQSTDKDEKPTDMSEQSMYILRLDLGLTPEGDKLDLAAGFELLGWSDKSTNMVVSGTDTTYNQWTVTDPSGNMSFYARGRYFKAMSSLVTLIPHAEFRYGKFEYDSSAIVSDQAELVRTNASDLMRFNVGVGMEYVPATNVLAVLDFGVMYDVVNTDITPANASASEIDEATFTLPYVKMGMDADVFSWMDVRFGATTYWENYALESGESKDTQGYPDNETYLGFGFHWNRLHVDVHTDPEVFLDGLNFISGAANNMNFRISAVYEMM